MTILFQVTKTFSIHITLNSFQRVTTEEKSDDKSVEEVSANVSRTLCI